MYAPRESGEGGVMADDVTVMVIRLDAAPLQAELAAAAQTLERRPEVIQGFLSLGPALVELAQVEAEPLAAGAHQIRLRAQLSDRARQLLAAAGADDVRPV